MPMSLRTLSALGLSLALAACGTTGSEPVRSDTAPATLASLPSPTRVWLAVDETTRTVSLTLYDDDSATLWIRGPAESVPHWGELHYPEKERRADLVRV